MTFDNEATLLEGCSARDIAAALTAAYEAGRRSAIEGEATRGVGEAAVERLVHEMSQGLGGDNALVEKVKQCLVGAASRQIKQPLDVQARGILRVVGYHLEHAAPPAAPREAAVCGMATCHLEPLHPTRACDWHRCQLAPNHPPPCGPKARP